MTWYKQYNALRKWIQRKFLDGMWIVMERIDKDVIEEFSDNITMQAGKEIHKCACKDGAETEGLCQDKDHEYACMTAETLKRVEQEWVERGIIT